MAKFKITYAAGTNFGDENRQETIEADRFTESGDWILFFKGKAATPDTEEVMRLKANRVLRVDRESE